MKIKIIKDSVYEIENKVNDWLQNNDIKKIKSHYQNHTPYHIIMMIFGDLIINNIKKVEKLER